MSNPQSKWTYGSLAGGEAESFSGSLPYRHYAQERRVTAREALGRAVRFLREREIESPRLNAEILLGHVLDRPHSHLYFESHRLLSISQLAKFKRLIVKRSRHEPLSYLIGKQSFMNLSFMVNSKVYIPRPETEILVDAVLKLLRDSFLQAQRRPLIVDLGTGCGNIAMSLAQEMPEAIVYATDISGEALEVAAHNAQLHHLEDRVVFIKGDLFDPLREENLEGRVDVIISNPPYVATREIESLPPEVRREPRIALDGGKEGLEYYQRIIPLSSRFLRRRALLALEIGHGQLEKIKHMIACQEDMESAGVVKDYKGIERIILTKKKMRGEG